MLTSSDQIVPVLLEHANSLGTTTVNLRHNKLNILRVHARLINIPILLLLNSLLLPIILRLLQLRHIIIVIIIIIAVIMVMVVIMVVVVRVPARSVVVPCVRVGSC